MRRERNPSYRRQIRAWQLLKMQGYQVAVELTVDTRFYVVISKGAIGREQTWSGYSAAGIYEAFDLASQARILDEGALLALATLPRLCQTCGRSR